MKQDTPTILVVVMIPDNNNVTHVNSSSEDLSDYLYQQHDYDIR